MQSRSHTTIWGLVSGGLALGLIGWVAGIAPAADPPNSGDGKISFNRDIRPILAENCFQCHGPDPASRKAKLRLDREEGFFAQREDGPTVVRGNPAKSPMYQRVTSSDPDEIMPPPKSHKTLKPEQKEKIRKWIEQGAVWQAHWSLIKPERPALPAVKDQGWERNAIDRFILARLEAAGLKPAPEADRPTLARRLALDLTGLPPEPALVEEFLKDNAPEAYERLVDRLLASPRYGEHRARYWLDAARYADTHGLHFDNFRDIWPYREWVIQAYNRNLPFDQFTIEQLAGDLLSEPSKDQLIATGFHRCNMTTNEGGTIPEENLANYARDRVETTSWVWLGLTANCAVCHDHKFDPLTTKDFYSMSAYFRNTTQGALDGNIRDTTPILILPMGNDAARWDAIPKETAATNTIIAERSRALRDGFDAWLTAANPQEMRAQIDATGLVAYAPLDRAPAASQGEPAVQWKEGGVYGPAPVFLAGAQIELGNAGDFERNQPFSYGAWMKLPPKPDGFGTIVARMDAQPDYRGWDVITYERRVAVHIIHKWPDDALKVVTAQQPLKPDTWHHVFVTYDGSSKAAGVKIFIDGKEAALQVDRDQLKNTIRNNVPLRAGRRQVAEHFTDGSVQDVRVYARKASSAEAREIALAGLTARYQNLPGNQRNEKQKDLLFAAYQGDDPQLKAAQTKLTSLENERKAIRGRSPVAHIQEEKRDSMPTAHILFRGEYDKPKDKVEANVFASLHPLPADAPKNRLGLARWLVSPENPLTARVIVNRHWQEIFGTGIVKTAEDFGIMGDSPSHEELLDYLAVEFRDGGWDTKKLIRLLVTSATYRQSAQVTEAKLARDAQNRLLSRGPRFRMDAEMIRDYALAASGTLSDKIGGPSVKPYQPEGVWEAVAMPESNTRFYKRDAGEALYRRSIYTFWKRAAPPASMDILNAPSREVSCVRRERTNTPLQALVTLNDPQYVEAARHLAANAIKTGGGEAAMMDFIARRALARPLSAEESAVLLDVQRDLLAHYKADPTEAKKLISVGESKPDGSLDAAVLAAWTMICNQVLNLDEALNK